MTSIATKETIEESFTIWALNTIYNIVIKYTWWTPLIIGIPGNAVCIAITFKKKNRHISSCTYMSALAMADTMTLVSVGWALTLMHWGFSQSLPDDNTREFLYKWIWYIVYLFAILSGLFLAEMSVDRLIAVRFPMAAVKLCTTSRAWKTAIATFFVIALLNANLFYTYRYKKEEILGTDILRAHVPEYPALEVLALAFQLGAGTLIPFVIIVISNLWIIMTVHKANKEREGMELSDSKGKKKRDKDAKYMTRMLILVCIAYILCSIPYRMYDAVMNLPVLKKMYRLDEMDDIYWILRYGVEYWCILEVWYQNYSINFYLYCIGGGRKYRNDVKDVLSDLFALICRRRSDESSSSVSCSVNRTRAMRTKTK